MGLSLGFSSCSIALYFCFCPISFKNGLPLDFQVTVAVSSFWSQIKCQLHGDNFLINSDKIFSCPDSVILYIILLLYILLLEFV